MDYVAVVESFNVGDGFTNVTVRVEDGTCINFKLTQEQIDSLNVGDAYYFKTSNRIYHEKEQLVLDSAESVFTHYKSEELPAILAKFYPAAPFDILNAVKEIEKTIKNIKNENIKAITEYIYNKHKDNFIIYPAATKFHHAYVGGLIYHTYRMLEVGKKLIEIYDYMNADYVYAGIILHDMAKVYEFSAPIHSVYSTEGILLGHIVLGVLEIDRAAKDLNLECEEKMLLEHIVLSHHGIPSFGSPKTPMMPEAVLVNMIDNMDSKLTVIGEMNDSYNPGEFSQGVPVIDKTRLYKPKGE